MPQRGRPSRGRQERKRRDWDRQAGQWGEYGRVEEVESEDDDGQGVGLGPRFNQKHFVSDDLRFTGVDTGFPSEHRKSYDYGDDSDFSDGDLDDAMDQNNGAAMQVALRDKEELLVRKAMERIRRAQMLGKTNVKLTQPELDALERKRQRAADVGKLKGRRSTPGGISNDRRSSKGGRAPGSRPTALPEPDRRKSRKSLARYERDSPPVSPGVAPPGFLVPRPDGVQMYAPIGYSDSPAALSSGSLSQPGSRSTSLQDQQQYQHTSPVPQYQHHHQQQRYFSVPEGSPAAIRPPSSSSRGSPRPLPDDPNWIPRMRSASSVQPYTVDPFQYQTYSPPMPHIASQDTQTRRNVSGPPDIQYSSVRRVPPTTYVTNARMAASSSEPSSLHLQSPIGDGKDHIGESDDEYDDIGRDQDVPIDENPIRGGYFSRTASAGIAGGRQRRGRR
ncbi:MAG: hypothetical protein M1830_003453 [Pleopsidium flavum]|nr:MAG: hypothetical protein M1830_003453 [Pleopsidium flavum]